MYCVCVCVCVCVNEADKTLTVSPVKAENLSPKIWCLWDNITAPDDENPAPVIWRAWKALSLPLFSSLL